MRMLARALACVVTLLVSATALSPAGAVTTATGERGQLPQRVRVDDRIGDAGGVRPTPRRLALSDLTEVYYAVPLQPDGVVVVSARFARLRARRPSGSLNQGFATTFTNGGERYGLDVANNGRPARISSLRTGRRIEPERLEVRRRTGPGGRLTVAFSAEAFSSDRFRFETVGLSNDFADSDRSAFDVTRPARLERIDRS